MGTRSKGDWWRVRFRDREFIECRNAGWLPSLGTLQLKPRCGKHRKFRRLKRKRKGTPR